MDTHAPAFDEPNCVQEMARIIEEAAQNVRIKLNGFPFNSRLFFSKTKEQPPTWGFQLVDNNGQKAGLLSVGRSSSCSSIEPFDIFSSFEMLDPYDGTADIVIYGFEGSDLCSKTGHLELARLLKVAATNLRLGQTTFYLHDLNGNQAGYVQYFPEPTFDPEDIADDPSLCDKENRGKDSRYRYLVEDEPVKKPDLVEIKCHVCKRAIPVPRCLTQGVKYFVCGEECLAGLPPVASTFTRFKRLLGRKYPRFLSVIDGKKRPRTYSAVQPVEGYPHV
jgi:hypothetical protein